ncbi:MAG: hypothetical protein CME64_00285 [Halobacteriovoraceae bacterium]|nr:hypothetical protein [Halobacteriovoraceae bacterium]
MDDLKIKNNDHRMEKKVFQVKSHKEEQKISLFSTGPDQYFFELSESNKRVKVSSQFAEKVNGGFIQKFIELKYGTMPYTKTCKHAYTLLMSGEEQRVCEQEPAKVKEVAKIIKSLRRQLKKLK